MSQKAFVIYRNSSINANKANNHRLYYAESQIEAIAFAERYFKSSDVFAEDVDHYKASFVLDLETAFICGICNNSYETCSCVKDGRR